MHRKPLRQQRPFPVPQMLQPFPSRTPRALPLPTPRPKLEDLLSHLDWATLQHHVHHMQPQKSAKEHPNHPSSPVPPRPHALHATLPDSATTDENRRPPGRARLARSAPSPSRLVRTSTAGAQGPRPVMAKAASRSPATARGIHTRHPHAASTRGIHTRHPHAASTRGIHTRHPPAASTPGAVSCARPPARPPTRPLRRIQRTLRLRRRPLLRRLVFVVELLHRRALLPEAGGRVVRDGTDTNPRNRQ